MWRKKGESFDGVDLHLNGNKSLLSGSVESRAVKTREDSRFCRPREERVTAPLGRARAPSVREPHPPLLCTSVNPASTV